MAFIKRIERSGRVEDANPESRTKTSRFRVCGLRPHPGMTALAAIIGKLIS
jgi:hypothetical protein